MSDPTGKDLLDLWSAVRKLQDQLGETITSTSSLADTVNTILDRLQNLQGTVEALSAQVAQLHRERRIH